MNENLLSMLRQITLKGLFIKHPMLCISALFAMFVLLMHVLVPHIDNAREYLLYGKSKYYYKCKGERIKESCIGFCLDGFETILHYDAKKYNYDSMRPGMYFEDSILRNSIGYKYYSICRPCERLYVINKKNVSCYDFYRVIDSASNKTQVKISRAST